MTTIPLAMLTALVAVVLLMIIGLVLWQKRSSSQLSILQNVAKTLEEIEKTLKAQEQSRAPENLVQPEQTTETERIQPEQAGEPEAQLPEEENEETDTEKALKAISQIMEEESDGKQTPESDSQTPAPAIDSMGKSGKSYTEEELELLIKE